jgi:TolA-binding protein
MKKHAVIGLLAILIATPVLHAAVPQKLNAFAEGERLVYTKLVEAYRRNQYAEVIAQRQILEKNYPNSIHLDNAYYMSGMLEFQNMRYANALKDFNVIRYKYTKSNKRASALLATAVTYQKLNLVPESHRVFSYVMKEYPGSPESQRAWMQLKLEKNQGKKAIKR